jgi:dipeptidyl aminopeptidase/acylaminoacyl peptidase
LQTHSGGDFYLVNADGTNLRRLSSGIDPALSPDGRYAAFTRWGSGEVGALWLHDLATGEERAILGEMLQPKSPTWSPDGAKVVVSFQHGGRREEEHKCVSLSQEIPHRAFDVRFKINEICFKLPPDPFWQLRLIDLATGAYQDLPSETYSYAPTWDPANPWRVVFAGSTGLQQLDLNRQEYFPFTRDLRDRGPVFSPDGGQVAVTYKQHGHWEVYTVSAADGSRLRLTPISILRETFNSAAPAWSPDGQQIAFVTDRNGRWEFWVMNADGSDPRPLLPPEVAAQIPVEYHGVDERLISWAAAGSGPTAGALLAAGAGEAEPQAEADASQIAAGAAEAPPQAEAETEEAKDDLAAAPPPEVLPVTGWGRLLVFPFVILIVVALLVKGAGSIRKGLHMN